MVMVEALACGTPVIAFREGAARELVVDGSTGFLVDDEAGDGRGRRRASGSSIRASAAPGSRGTATSTSSPQAYVRAYRSAMRTAATVAAWLRARVERAGRQHVRRRGTARGDLRADEGREHGFFSDDTRFISRWQLRVGEQRLALLGIDREQHFAAQFFSTPDVGPRGRGAVLGHAPAARSITCWLEEITVTNHRHERGVVELALEVGRRLRRPLRGQGRARRWSARSQARWDDRTLALVLPVGRVRALVTVDAPTARRRSTRAGFAFALELGPGEAASVDVHDHAARPRSPAARSCRARRAAASTELRRAQDGRARRLAGAAPAARDRASRPSRARTARASSDLGALRLRPDLAAAATLPAAGLPWFMALFGRDSLITSFQALPYLPGARGDHAAACSPRARRRSRDDVRDEEPGKILHELRVRRADGARASARTRRTSGPRTPRRCSSSCSTSTTAGPATTALVRGAGAARPRRARAGSTTAATADGDGYVEYAAPQRADRAREPVLEGLAGTRSSSPTARSRAGRSRPARSRATSTTRGAARARLAREVWDDPALADAARARRPPSCSAAFRRDFWMPDARLPRARARRRQAPGRRAAPRTSATCSGAASSTTTRPPRVAERLLGDELFSGLGRAHAGDARGRLQPARLPHRHRLAARELADRRRARALRLPTTAAAVARGDPRGRAALPAPPARGVRRLSGGADERPRRVPDRVAPAGLGGRGAAAAADDAAGAAARGPPPSQADLAGGLGHVALRR